MFKIEKRTFCTAPMAMLSQTLKNLKFMKNKKQENEKVTEKTLSYYACKNIISVYQRAGKIEERQINRK